MPDLLTRIAADGAAHPQHLNAMTGLGLVLLLLGVMCLGAMSRPLLRRLHDACDRWLHRRTNRPSTYELLTYGGEK